MKTLPDYYDITYFEKLLIDTPPKEWEKFSGMLVILDDQPCAVTFLKNGDISLQKFFKCKRCDHREPFYLWIDEHGDWTQIYEYCGCYAADARTQTFICDNCNAPEKAALKKASMTIVFPANIDHHPLMPPPKGKEMLN